MEGRANDSDEGDSAFFLIAMTSPWSAVEKREGDESRLRRRKARAVIAVPTGCRIDDLLMTAR